MRLKGIFAEKSAWFQILLLLFLVLSGAIIASVFTFILIFFFKEAPANMPDNPDYMRIVQLISACLLFLFPAFGCTWLYSKSFTSYLQIRKILSAKVYFLTFISMILIGPVINFTGFINKMMRLPSFLEPLEQWMQTQEVTAERITLLFLSGNDIVTLLFNLLVIAVAAGVTEEFLFRGTIQRILGKRFISHHTIIWITAIIFSAIHVQFYGFIPRMLLGAYFGYLLYWSRSIWIPVFAHFLNNAFAVVIMSNSNWKEQEWITGEINTDMWVAYLPAVITGTVLFYICVRQLRRELKSV